MYLHLGQDTLVNNDSVVGIFDMDTSTVMKSSRDFLSIAEKQGKVVNVSYELPKSFVICKKEKNVKVYISQLSSATLQKRANSKRIFFD